MYTKHVFLFFYLLVSSFLLSAQNIVSVKGLVKDSLGNPIVAASVAIINNEGAGIVFEKTNHQGFFNCKVADSTEALSIKVTALGYQQSILSINKIPKEQYLIILKKRVQQLQEVTVKSSNKISLSSDTLKYNVKAFKDQNDRAIADLINRLPGIQVDENGAISYNGKRIANVYIDGDDLLGGKYKLATNNVPVGAVEQVQVIERDQPIKALNGYVVANNVSINLKLTDSARTMTFNTGYFGLGNKAYSAELNNIVFQRKVKSINNLKTNNIGENLENENADIGVFSNNNEINLKNPQPYLSMEAGILPSITEKYYLMNNDNAANINTLFKFKSDWSLRLNVSTLQLKRKYNYNNSVNYFLPNADTVGYSEIQNNIFKLNNWQIQAQVEKNSNSVYLKSSTKISLPKWDRNGNTDQNGQALQQSQPTNYTSLSNETSLVKALGVNHIIQYNSALQYYRVNEALTVLPGVQENIVNDSTGYLMLNQQVHTRNVFINHSATYKAKFNQVILSASLGVSYEQNKLNTNLYKTDSANIVNTVGNQFKNNIVFDNLSFFGRASVIYLLKKGSISIETSPTYSFIKSIDKEKIVSSKNPYFLTNPLIEFRKNIGKYAELNLIYKQQAQFGQINDIYSGAVLTNYRQFNSNDTPLPKTDINSFGARYTYRKPLKMFFYNLGFNYDRTKQNFINTYTIDSGLTKSIAIDFRNKSDKYTLNGNVSKYLFFFSTNVSAFGSLGFQRGNNFYNNEIAAFDIYNMNISVTARKKIFSKATLSVTGEVGKFINEQKTLRNAVIKNTTAFEKIKAEWQHNLTNQILYSITYNLTSYRQSLQNSITNNFVDFKVKYAPAKWESYFELQCINLINQSTYTQINSNSNQQSIFQIPLRTRTFLLKYSFTF